MFNVELFVALTPQWLHPGASRVEQLAGNLQLAGAGELHSQVQVLPSPVLPPSTNSDTVN